MLKQCAVMGHMLIDASDAAVPAAAIARPAATPAARFGGSAGLRPAGFIIADLPSAARPADPVALDRMVGGAVRETIAQVAPATDAVVEDARARLNRGF